MKTVLRYALRLLSVLLTAAAVFGLLYAGGAVSLGQDSADAVSAATAQNISAEDMNGKWVVLLNRTLHDKAGTSNDWKRFFSFDENVPLIMEDITCKARLPENQMTIREEPGVMLLSKAELGHFDVIILSEAAANAYAAQTLYDRAEVLTIRM